MKLRVPAWRSAVLGTLILLGSVGPGSAQTPLGSAFTYQGRLVSAGGLVSDTVAMTFRVYADPVGGAALGTVTLPSVTVANGLFTVTLDFGIGVFDGAARWLGISIGAEAELVPRQPLSAAPYSLYAVIAAGVVDGSITNADIAPAAAIAGSKLAGDSVTGAQIADGPGSGLVADFLDDLDSSLFLRNDVNGVLEGTLRIDNLAGADVTLSEAGIDRSVAAPTTFTLQNPDAGASSTMQLQVESGTTAGAPAYSFVGDPDTGVFRSAANTLAFAAGGSQVATISTLGLSAATTAVTAVAVRGTGPGTSFGEGIFGTTGSGGRGVVAQNTSSAPALHASSASGDHLTAGPSIGFVGQDPVLRVTNAGSLLSEATIAVGNPVTVATAAPVFNSFGNPANKDEAVISSANDVYVEGGLELDGNAFVGGKARVASLQVTGGAAAGRVLTSDASGNATWQLQATAPCTRACSVGHVQTLSYVDGSGACVPAFRIPCFPYKCGAAALCKDQCASDADCADGATCNTATSACAPHGTVCNDDFTVEDANGQVESCIPYKCIGGVCQQQCQNSNDCYDGYTCSAGGRCNATP